MDEQKMNELYELAKENNHMLKAMRRSAFIGGIFKFILWILMLVVVPYITWLFIQPYVEGVMHTYQSVKKTNDAISSSTSMNFDKIQEFFKQFQSNKTQ